MPLRAANADSHMKPAPETLPESTDPAAEPPAPACVVSFNGSDPSGAGGVAGDVRTIAALGAPGAMRLRRSDRGRPSALSMSARFTAPMSPRTFAWR